MTRSPTPAAASRDRDAARSTTASRPSSAACCTTPSRSSPTSSTPSSGSAATAASTAADLALLTDGLRAEREQGITIDVAYRYFATASRSFVLADCPGHVQYTRNTVTGASTADVVVLLVDARKGVLEQTRRHLAVTALLRVPHVVVAVNKIDLVDFAQERLRAGRGRGAGRGPRARRRRRRSPSRSAPSTATTSSSAPTRTPWYAGPSLLELLEALPPSDDPSHESFRLPVQLVIRPQGARATTPTATTGGTPARSPRASVRVGDEVVVLPVGAAHDRRRHRPR